MAKRTPAAAPAAHAMERCIDNCLNCHRICLETAARHFRGESPKSLPETLIRLLIDCTDICRTSADFMVRGSDMHAHTCRACAAVCDGCAEECDRLGREPHMAACVEACRRCAESCREMSAALS
jgi:hypothetical protein